MRASHIVIFAAVALSVVALSAPADAAPKKTSADTALRRFAMIIGANNGGPDRVKLQYAVTDAAAVAQVIGELGGVAPTDVAVLSDPSRAQLNTAFAQLKRRLARARRSTTRVEILFYYSGHSDESGLLLGDDRYLYQDLRTQIRTLPADVHIAILDSCASGSFTRTKGGHRRPPFLVDTSNKVRGHAFLSSSSTDEAAQEAESIGASFFTHYLISGLRGGADTNRDGQVTLNEAYQFAFDETVARTERTRYGTQHPAYEMHLAGTGDVVMTDLRTTSASLVVGKQVSGRLFIRDASGRLVVELTKPAGRPVTLGLAPERYEITVQQGDDRFAATVDLQGGRQVTLNRGQLSIVTSEATVARGTAAIEAGDLALAPVAISLMPPIAIGAGDTRNWFALNVFTGAGGELNGLEIGTLLNMRRHNVIGAQLAGFANWNGGDVTGLQISAVVNRNRGAMGGFQVAGGGNLNGGEGWGLQAAGVFNANGGDRLGLQVAGGANLNSGASRGVQAAGVFNTNSGEFVGLQAAGGLNRNGDSGFGLQAAGVFNSNGGAMGGLQFAGGGNHNRDGFVGIQGAGIFNSNGGDVLGVQVAGAGNLNHGDFRGLQAGLANVVRGHTQGLQLAVVNVGNEVTGMQLGLINIARHVRGVQLGLVNVAGTNDGAPIGLVSVVKNGHRAVEAWTSDIAPINAGFKLGGNRVYSLFTAGVGTDHYLFGIGLGTHNPIGSFYLDIDAVAYEITDHGFRQSADDFVAQVRAALGIPIGDFSVFGGASLSAAFAFDGSEGGDLSFFDGRTYVGDNVVTRLFPGLFAGIAY